MTTNSRTFRIFVSSTFSDLKTDRHVFQEHIFPRLRERQDSRVIVLFQEFTAPQQDFAVAWRTLHAE